MNFFYTVTVWFLLIIIQTSCTSPSNGRIGHTPLVYTGSTTVAQLDDENYQTLTRTAYQGSVTGSALRRPSSATDISSLGGASRPLRLVQQLKQVLITAATLSSHTMRASSILSDTLEGSCGGTATYTINLTETLFDGVFEFSNYCNEGAILNGTVDYNGTMIAGLATQFSMSFEDLSSQVGDEQFTCAGTVEVDQVTMTTNLLLQDVNSSKVLKLENYTITVTAGSTYSDLTFAGKFYDEEAGYLTLSTALALRISTGDDAPSAGILIATGANGATTRLTILTNSTYQIEADLDADTIYEENSGSLTWD